MEPRRKSGRRRARQPAEIGIGAKVEVLLRPATYPEATRRVEAVETHMSWVFLTDAHAYKLKKPVRYDLFDFRTVESRRRNCEEEVRLNRRLAPEAYIGTVPLTLDSRGALHLGGFDEAVDWLVKMHRLPQDHALQRAIETGTLRAAQVRGAALDLARFYKDAAPVALDPAAYLDRFRADIEADRAELCKRRYGLPRRLVEKLSAAQSAFLDRRAEVLERRASERRIVEAHGDLRPEHIFLGPRPQIIDCLEFRRALRLLDPADELSFLALECERLGAPAVGDLVFEVYRQVTGDAPPPELLHFYKAYRACLRAKIAVWHLRDPETREPEKWPALARTYLGLAEEYVEKLA